MQKLRLYQKNQHIPQRSSRLINAHGTVGRFFLLSSYQTKHPTPMMKNHYQHKFLIIFIALSLCFAVGCDNHPINELAEDLSDEFEEIDKKQEEQKEEEEAEEIFGIMTAKVNKKPFITPNFLKMVRAGVSINMDYYTIQIYGFDVELGLRKAQYIILLIFGKDFDSIKPGTEWNTIVKDYLEGGATAAYSENRDSENNTETSSSIDELEKVHIKITSIDHEKQLLSGEFSFSGKNEDTGKTYVVTDGTFKDFQYTITEN